MVEDGDGAGDDPSQDPDDGTDGAPATVRPERALGHDVGVLAAPVSHVDVLDADVCVDDAGDDDGRKGDAESDFLDDWAGRTEGRGGDVRAGVVVDDYGDCDIEGDGDALKEGESLGELSGLFELGDEALSSVSVITQATEGH